MKSLIAFILLLFSIPTYSQIKEVEYYDDWGDYNTILLNTETGDTIAPGKYSNYYGYNENFKLFIVGTGDSLGVINANGKEIINPIYSRIDIDKGGLIRVQVGEYYNEEGKPDPKFGILSKEGKWLVEAKYDYLGSLSSGLIRANIGGYAYLDGDGTFSGEYDEITGGKWGFIDAKGKVKIPFEFTYARDFNDGLAKVYVGGSNDDWLYDGSWTYINAKGEPFISKEYMVASENINGLFIISKTITQRESDGYDTWNVDQTTYGLSNTKGEILIQPTYSNIKIVAEKYIILMQEDTNYNVSNDLLDFDLKMLREGLSEVEVIEIGRYDSLNAIYFKVKVDSLFGIIDTTGVYVVEPIYSDIQKDGNYNYFVRKGGEITIDYYSTTKVYNGFAGIVDYEGNEVLPMEFDEILRSETYDGLPAHIARKSGKWGVLNSEYVAIIPFKYDTLLSINMWSSDPHLFVAKYNGKWGVIDIKDTVIIDLKFDVIENSEYLREDMINGFISATLNGKQCIIDETGSVKFPPNFTRIEVNQEYWMENKVKVFNGDLIGVSDTLGNLIIPVKYEDIRFESGGAIVTTQTIKTVEYPYHKIEKLDSFSEVLTWGGYQVDLGNYNYEKVYIVKRKGKWGLLNITTGKMVYACVFDEILEDNFYCGINRIELKGKYGVVNTSGALVVPAKFDEIVIGECDYYEDKESVKIIYVQRAGKWGAFNKDGSIKYEIQFNSKSEVPVE